MGNSSPWKTRNSNGTEYKSAVRNFTKLIRDVMHGLKENKDTGAKRGNEGFCLLCAGGDRFRSVKAAKVLQQATQVEPCADTLRCAAAR